MSGVSAVDSPLLWLQCGSHICQHLTTTSCFPSPLPRPAHHYFVWMLALSHVCHTLWMFHHCSWWCSFFHCRESSLFVIKCSHYTKGVIMGMNNKILEMFFYDPGHQICIKRIKVRDIFFVTGNVWMSHLIWGEGAGIWGWIWGFYLG